MTDTTAKIRAKGLDATGVTEAIANEMYSARGRHYMAIVELRVEETHEKADGTRGVHLILTQVEPATDPNLAEHLRELTRVTYFNRQTHGHTDGQLALDGVGTERTVADVLAAGAAHRPHPFIPDDASKDTPICDVCGHLEAAGVHSVQDQLPYHVDEPDDDEGDDLADIEAEQDLIAEEWVDTQHRDEPEPEDPWDDTRAAVPDPFTVPATS